MATPKTYTRRPVASTQSNRHALPQAEPQFPLLDQDVSYVVVVLDTGGQPERAMLIFPTAADAEAHARYHRLGDYRVIPAYFSHVDPRRESP